MKLGKLVIVPDLLNDTYIQTLLLEIAIVTVFSSDRFPPDIQIVGVHDEFDEIGEDEDIPEYTATFLRDEDGNVTRGRLVRL